MVERGEVVKFIKKVKSRVWNVLRKGLVKSVFLKEKEGPKIRYKRPSITLYHLYHIRFLEPEIRHTVISRLLTEPV